MKDILLRLIIVIAWISAVTFIPNFLGKYLISLDPSRPDIFYGEAWFIGVVFLIILGAVIIIIYRTVYWIINGD